MRETESTVMFSASWEVASIPLTAAQRHLAHWPASDAPRAFPHLQNEPELLAVASVARLPFGIASSLPQHPGSQPRSPFCSWSTPDPSGPPPLSPLLRHAIPSELCEADCFL